MPADPPAPRSAGSPGPAPRPVPAWLLAGQLALAGWLALRNLDRINPDAIGHLAAARHLLEGRPGLALTGAWGPLSSWLLVPLLALGSPPLAAARLVLVGAGLAHTAGTWRLLAALEVAPAGALAATAAAALFASAWAGSVLTGDLLLAAAAVWTGALLLEAKEPGGTRPALAAAAMALAKPIGLPLAACLLVGGGLVRPAGAGAARQLLAAGLLLAPWFTALSLHYGHPTLGGSAGLNLAVGDPGLETPIHGFPTFTGPHRPAPGRVTSWEDPVELPPRPWSPAADPTRLRELVRRNLATTGFHLWLFDYSGFLLLALVVVPAWGLLAPRPRAGWRDRFLAVPVLALAAGYLPFPIHTWRYDWPLLGFGLAAAAVLVERTRVGAGIEPTAAARLRAAAGRVLGHGGPLVAGLVAFGLAAAGTSHQAADARRLAALFRARGAASGLASWGPGPHQPTVATSLFTAWYLDRPWYGYVHSPAELETALALGAGGVLVEGAPEGPAWLTGDPRLEVLGRVPADEVFPGLAPVVYSALAVRSGP